MILIIFFVSLLAVSAVCAADNATDDAVSVEKTADDVVSAEENQAILSENNDVGTFNDLQTEIDNATDGSVLNLTRDYNGAYNSKIRLDKDLTIDGRGHTIDCLEEGGCIAFYSTMGTVFKLSENKNVVAVYSSKAAYKVLVTRNGKAVGAGERVTITYNGKAYEVQTDKNGYATLNLNTKVKVNKYTITAEYKGEKVTNDVIIFRVHNNFTNNCLGFEIRCDFRYRCR